MEKRSIIKTILFFVKSAMLVILIAITVDVLGDLMCTDEKYIRMSNYHNEDVVFVGSSHVYRNIIPQEIYDKTGMTSAMLSSSNQGMANSYYLLKEYMKHNTPQVVFVEVYVSGRSSRDAFAIQAMPTLSLNKYLAYKQYSQYISFDEASRFLLFHNQYKYLGRESFRYITTGAELWSWGYRGAIGYIYPITEQERKDRYDREIVVDQEEEYKWLQKICDLTKDKEISLVLFATPYMLAQGEEEYYNDLERFASDRGVPFFNFNQEREDIEFYMDSDYADYGHLSYAGGYKLTEYLADYLSEDMKLTHREGVPIEGAWEDYREHYQHLNDMDMKAYGTDLNGFIALAEEAKENSFVTVCYVKKEGYDSLAVEQIDRLTRLGFDVAFMAEEGDAGAYVAVKRNGIIHAGEGTLQLNMDGETWRVYSPEDSDEVVVEMGPDRYNLCVFDGISVSVFDLYEQTMF